MDRDQIAAATADERWRIAELIDGLDESELATPSLCAGWDVKTVGAHLLSFLTDGTFRMTMLGVRRGSPDRAIDELARRKAQLPVAEIAAGLRAHASRRYWRPPPREPGLLAEVLAHSGDIRIALDRSFDPDPRLVETTLDFLTGPFPVGLVSPGKLRGIRWEATDVDRTWGKGARVRGRAADLMMAAVGRTAVMDRLEGDGLAVLRRRYA